MLQTTGARLFLFLSRYYYQEMPMDQQTAPAAIRQDSSEVYQAVAGFRRTLHTTPDIPAETLREMLGSLLTVVELLLQSVDRNQDALELIQRNRERANG